MKVFSEIEVWLGLTGSDNDVYVGWLVKFN